MEISFTWSTRRDGNAGFVLEQSSTGQAREFGPMPAHIVPAFVQARRKVIEMRATNMSIQEAIDEDYEWMKDFDNLMKADTTQRG